jgi:hypothetical protein
MEKIYNPNETEKIFMTIGIIMASSSRNCPKTKSLYK